ncbi:Pkinase-domain-containing protein [Delitschia confertaspora ATCC 74209]|uniref:non-specific serine/threonine protein kinase n=1 Tax=Delitschia confertaspora ATCC 74209 TaxID=1513339 RepID=A0A9P4JWC3_9PLEO|nr:Pkinase-domain-containing protein [Delitschia confertaspora ATCC 74209]
MAASPNNPPSTSSKPTGSPVGPSSTVSSLHSQPDGNLLLPPSSNPSTQVNGNGDTTLKVKKPTMTSRISGMFRRDESRETSRSNNVSSEKIPENQSTNGTAAKSVRPTPSRQGSTTKKKDLGVTPYRRFWTNEDGTHEHHLKVGKRQEKLSDMFQNLMLGKKKEGHQEEQPLSLMANWVDVMRNEREKLAEQKNSPNHTQSLVQKYGKCQEVVGRGAFGIVRVAHKTDAKDPKREQLYAVKEFKQRPGESDKKYQKRLTAEFCISSSMAHPNVINTLDLLQDEKGVYCEVMEYCSGGDLYTLVLSAGQLEVTEADCFFKQLMRGVEYMHEMGVAHRDLKPENLLLTQHGSIKITDFGNGECFRMAWEKEAHMTAGLCGSAPYIAPEEYVDREFDPRAVDVWACGIIYMAMRTGRHLWRVAQKGEDEFFDRYLEDRKEESGYRPIEVLRRRQCRNVIYSILDPNPNRRLTAHQVLFSEWVKEIKVCRAGNEGF